MSSQFHKVFKFLDWDFDVSNYRLTLAYELENVGKVCEEIQFPEFDLEIYHSRKSSIQAACDLLHWLAGVSYYKAGLAEDIEFSGKKPSQSVSQFIHKTWKNGLAEMAYKNQISLKDRMKFNSNQWGQTPECLTPLITENLNLSNRALVPLGGGKDSLVTIEELKTEKKDFNLFVVGSSKLILEVADFIEKPLIQVQRKIDQKLIEYNQQGAFNGHVPITAINSAIAVLTALLFDFNEIVFSNEKSAEFSNTTNDDGDAVNHQYSKSYEFENDFQEIIRTQVASDLRYYSKQRNFSEFEILRKFSKYPQYFPVFSSCNRNFHIDGSKNKNFKWCCDCPKCRFVFLGLAPFIQKSTLLDIFGSNMLDDESQLDGFAELLGLKGIKPFECVGTLEESQTAFQLIKDKGDWSGDTVVKQFSEVCPKADDELLQKLKFES